jgi:hypothetical protein
MRGDPPVAGVNGWHDVRDELPTPRRVVWGYRKYRDFPPTSLGMLVLIGSRFYTQSADEAKRQLRHGTTMQPTLWKYIGGKQ